MTETRDRRDRQRYEEVYAGTYADLVRFAVRRGHPRDQAEDVAAEAFAVAWQRLADLPAEPGEARAWLFGIARRLLLAKRRADTRGQALSVRIAERAATDGPTPGHDDLIATSLDLTDAWNRLSPTHQEALSLSVWEGLGAAQAAQVLGISPVAFRIRLSRARRILRHHLGSPPGAAAAEAGGTPTSNEKGYA